MRLFVLEMEFDRGMSVVTRETDKVRTIKFPNSVKEIRGGAFEKNGQLRAAVLNEGLEVLGDSEDDQRCGVFSETGIRQVTLPSSLRVLGARAFSRCGELRRVAFAEGIAIAEIGAGCFSGSGVEQVTVPASVTVIRDEAFSGCEALNKVSF